MPTTRCATAPPRSCTATTPSPASAPRAIRSTSGACSQRWCSPPSARTSPPPPANTAASSQASAAGRCRPGCARPRAGRSSPRTSACAPEELHEQRGGFLRLLLLHPVAGAGNEVRAAEIGAHLRLHALELARLLVHAPVGRAGDVHRGNADFLPRAGGAELRREIGAGGAAIPLQAALEAVALERLRIHRQLLVGQPRRYLGWHVRRYRLRHPLVEL